MRQCRTTHHRVSEVFKRRFVGIAGADPVVRQRKINERSIARQPWRQGLRTYCFQAISLRSTTAHVLSSTRSSIDTSYRPGGGG